MWCVVESLKARAFPVAALALACALLPLPAQAANPQVVKEGESVGFRVKSQPLAITPVNLDVSKFAFTAPGRAEPVQPQAVERGFTFTPSRALKGGVSVGMTMRTLAPPAAGRETAATSTAGTTSSSYDFDLSLGYRGFAVSGGTSHVDTGIGGRNREGMDIGIGYGARNWRAGLQASSERESVNLMPRLEGDSQRYTVEARGALDLSPKISVGGTLRYRPAAQNPTLLDPLRDDRAVIVGGAVVF